MRCADCTQVIPDDAAFCIYCATPTGGTRPDAPPAHPPATGSTIRLQPHPVPQPSVPRRPAPKAVYVQPKRRARPKHGADHSGIVFLIGFLFLVATGFFWPGILLLIGVTRFMKHTVRGRPNRALGKLVFWVGLAGLITLLNTPYFWPGLLGLLFVSHIVGKQQRVHWI